MAPRRTQRPSPSTSLVTASSVRRRVRRPRSNVPRALTSLHPDVLTYARCLADPFNNPPTKLGFGTMVQTELYTLVTRIVLSASSDGSLGLFMIPSSYHPTTATGGGGLYYHNNTMGTIANYTQVSWFNPQMLADSAEELRVVGGAIRALPMVPGTSAPGTAYVASSPSANYNGISAISKSTLISNPMFTWGAAAQGSSCSIRPIDPNSFTFHHNLVTGTPPTDDPPVTVPVIVLTGLPASCSVNVEAVLHVEYIRSATSSALIGPSTGQTAARPALPRLYASVESLWDTVRGLLPPASTVAAGASLANTLLSGVSGAARLLGYSGSRRVQHRAALMPGSLGD